MGFWASLFGDRRKPSEPAPEPAPQPPKKARLVPSMAQMMRRYDATRTTDQIWDRVRAYDDGVNSELGMALDTLRDRSWYEYRNNATARAAIESLVNLTVSTGIDTEPMTGDEKANKSLHDVWMQWADHAGADGETSLWELQRQAMRSVAVSGEALWQLVEIPIAEDPRRPIPLAINPLDPKQLSMEPVGKVPAGLTFVQGKEIDAYGRTHFYHIVGSPDKGFSANITDKQIGVGGSTDFPMPSNLADGQFEFQTSSTGQITGVRVPASKIIHIYEKLRPGQMRGEPKLAPILGTLQQEKDLVESELTSSKIAAAFAVFIASGQEANVGGLSTSEDDSDATDGQGNEFYRIEGGAINKLQPGETVQQVASTRPSQQINPFRQMLHGDIAAALGIRRTDLDRDYSQADYSSMRAAQLDVTRSLDPMQEWFGIAVSCDVYHRILPFLIVAANLIPPKGNAAMRQFMQCRLLPVGHPYVDPEKDGKAALQNIRNGLSTWQEEVGKRGRDARRVVEQLEEELKRDLYKQIFEDGRDLTKAEPDEEPGNGSGEDDERGALFADDRGNLLEYKEGRLSYLNGMHP